MNPVILFDGVCNFCDASVQFILERDDKEMFRFASLQSDAGQELLKEYTVPDDVDSMILIEDGKVYYKSAAALRISRHLKGPWKLLYGLIIVPAPLRNIVYDLIAKNRFKWFGQKDSCMLPPPNVRRRFL
ncbi:thiol-disulfide oxidoreductase DCC family protein [Bacillus sp. ISL-35]|uniref:thiol-disulfide oxidoreductase DCC family protein n=1 Tax=Bacillus sp. ISL-35 TaxID=2819122 RepID=UPI001BE7F2C3|nr:thiol-disulfide oxidoreductase DCC family protein [Bacillus sp. ISL-35]MBT2681203.1 thiol-disulfide oxidoreductase DCC family protein [Bacillus sp. ISL-35]MBT2706114.1 thiol-disulfide oxidoreductase DCC family protein [Chryseobacterium sp. ISL-80]